MMENRVNKRPVFVLMPCRSSSVSVMVRESYCSYLGLTPTEYIRKLRLSQAALRLRDGEDKVIDIAFDLGFGSVDTFTRAFFREYGCNPSDYRKNPSPVPLFIPYGVKYRELRKEYFDMSNVQTVFVQVVHKPERLCIIKRGVRAEDYFPYCEEVSCDVWGILMSMRSLCGEPVCLWLQEKYKKPNTSTYVQGVEVEMDYMGIIPEGFDVIHLPEADYLLFQGQPFREEDYCEAIQAVQQAMDGYHCCSRTANACFSMESSLLRLCIF